MFASSLQTNSKNTAWQNINSKKYIVTETNEVGTAKSSRAITLSDRVNSNSGKLRATTCQGKITETTPTTNEWLILTGILKKTNEKDFSRVLKAELLKKYAVVVKISDSDTLQKEYIIGNILKSVPGFMESVCYFECNDNFKDYPKSEQSGICKGPGNEMKALIMPYLEEGSINSFDWMKHDPSLLRTCILQLICSLMQAYESKGILHSDTHLDNVLLKKTKKQTVQYMLGANYINIPTNGYLICITDFELSFNEIPTNRGRAIDQLYNDILHAISDLAVHRKIKFNNLNEISNILYKLMKTPQPVINGFELLYPLINQITYEQKQERSFVYNPYNY